MITTYLQSLGFTRLRSDWGLYTRGESDAWIYILVYVDDILIAGKDVETVIRVKAALMEKWSWTDSGEAGYILGFKLTRNRIQRSIRIAQTAYINQIIERFGLTEAKGVATPLVHGLHLTSSQEETDPELQTTYRAIVGSIMWLAIASRPDIAYAASVLGQFNANPNEQHLTSAKRVLRYLKSTAHTELKLGMQNDIVLAGG